MWSVSCGSRKCSSILHPKQGRTYEPAAVQMQLLKNNAPQVTRDWFPIGESAIASGGITLAMVLGSTLGLSVTPLIVTSSEDISTMNIIWFIPTAITFIMALIFVRSDHPATPPSKSSSVYIANQPRVHYLMK